MAKEAPTLIKAGSHSVTLSPFNDRGFKEEVFLYFNAQWRGQDVAVTMQADRYTHSSGLSDWRAYLSDGKYGAWDAATGWYVERGDDITGTARARLGDILRPITLEWLASDAYRDSERCAYFRAIKGTLYGARPYSGAGSATSDMRKSLEKYRGKLTTRQHGHLVRLANAFDRFATLYNAEP